MNDRAFRTIIVPAEHQKLAQQLCGALAEGDAGAGMFTTPLSATGALPGTHYISSGKIWQEFADLLPLTSFDEEGEPSTRPGQVATIDAMASGAGFDLPNGTVAALLGTISVTELDPWTDMSRLGLQLVQEETE